MKKFSTCASNSILAIRRKKEITKMLVSVIRIIVLLAIGYVILYPLLHMLITSTRSRESFMNASRIWIPESFAVKENYKIALEILDYSKSILATLKYQIISALIEVVTCSIAAYGFARFKFKLKGPLIAWLFLTILIFSLICSPIFSKENSEQTEKKRESKFSLIHNYGFAWNQITRIQLQSNRSNFVWRNDLIGAFYSIQTKKLPINFIAFYVCCNGGVEPRWKIR